MQMAKQESIRRGKNFCRLEDRQLCVSWVYTTQDSIKGTDQNAIAFWSTVLHNAQTAVPSLATRTTEAIRQRFGAISRAVMKFSGCLKSVRRLHKSGTSAADEIVMALELYKTEHREEFKYMECFEILKHCPKFVQVEPPKFDSPGAEATNSPVADPVTPLARPTGQKAAKARLRIEEKENRKLAVLEDIAKATKERNTLLRHANRIKIVTTSLEGLDEVAAKILRLEKEKILEELENNQVVEDGNFSASSSSIQDQSTNSDIMAPIILNPMGDTYGSFDPNSLIESDYDSN